MAFERHSQKHGGRLMKSGALITLGILVSAPALAAETPPSLFFTSDESAAIASIVAKEGRPADASSLRLDALFYYGPGDWVFILGGQRWMPGSDQPHLHVLGVEANQIRLQYADEKELPREIVLKPHQAFDMATGTVVER